jgi:signal transduction histidine kinase
MDLSRGKDQFIAAVVHELRQPLAPMQAAVEFMKLRVSRESGERARQVLEEQLRVLARLVEDLMDVTRLKEAKTRLRCEPVDLREVLKTAINGVNPMVRAKRQTIRVSAPAAEARVNADADRMTQVFVNLLSNASKFSSEESPISAAISCNNAHVLVDILDQGRGIASEMLPHVFDVFRQSTEGESGGLGIGLFIVRRLVELHGGSVKARSDGPGRGSVFTVKLPRAS